jgi:hypothetical protein
MKTAKLIVMYPTPVDVDLFEQRYAEEHVPMAEKSWLEKPALSRRWLRRVWVRNKHLSIALPKFIFHRCRTWKLV